MPEEKKQDRDERFSDWAVGDKEEPGTIEILDEGDIDEAEYDKEEEDEE